MGLGPRLLATMHCQTDRLKLVIQTTKRAADDGKKTCHNDGRQSILNPNPSP